jgi:hypothetical protein
LSPHIEDSQDSPTISDSERGGIDIDFDFEAKEARGCPRKEEKESEVIDGEVLPPEDAPAKNSSAPQKNFDRFFDACAEPRGLKYVAEREWRKLSPDEQQRACERPSNGRTFACSWLRDKAFNLTTSEAEHRHGGRPYGHTYTTNGFARIAREDVMGYAA